MTFDANAMNDMMSCKMSEQVSITKCIDGMQVRIAITGDIEPNVWLSCKGYAILHVLAMGGKIRCKRWTQGCYVYMESDEDGDDGEMYLTSRGTDVFCHDVRTLGVFILDDIINMLHSDSFEVMLDGDKAHFILRCAQAFHLQSESTE
jgi:hypothetical protein